MERTSAGTSTAKWAPLYRTAGFATIAMLVLIPVQIAVFVLSPMPTTIQDWFALYQDNWLLGMLHQDLLYIVNNVIVAVMYLAFYVSLKESHPSLMTLAFMLGLLGISAYLASNKSIEMLHLSGMYQEAVHAADKTTIELMGQSMLREWQGTAFDIYYVLNGIALILMTRAMLKSPLYGRRTALIGLLAGLLMLIPSTAGALGLVFSLLSLIPWYIFSVLVAMKFLTWAKAGTG